MSILNFIVLYYYGICDSFAFWRIWKRYGRNSLVIRHHFWQCFIFHSILFLNYMLLHYFVQPIIHTLLIAQWSESINSNHWCKIGNIINQLLFKLYDALWTIPVYFLGIVLTIHWYYNIAENTLCIRQQIRLYKNYLYYKQQKNIYKHSIFKIQQQTILAISNTVYTVLFLFVYWLQMNILHYIPWFGSLYSYMCLTCFYSFNCFNYKWTSRQWTIHQKLSHIEYYCIYFVGFGTPYATLAFLWTKNSFFFDSMIYTILTPIFIMCAIDANRFRRYKIQKEQHWAILLFSKCLTYYFRILIQLCDKLIILLVSGLPTLLKWLNTFFLLYLYTIKMRFFTVPIIGFFFFLLLAVKIIMFFCVCH